MTSQNPATRHDHDEHREGLAYDLPAMAQRGMVRRPVTRRGLLTMLGGLGAATLGGCAASSTSSDTSAGTSSAAQNGPGGAPPSGGGGGADASTTTVADGDIPEETGGPYPADGSNGVNVLSESGIVRSDITRSFGDASGVAEGVPLTIALKVSDHEGTTSTPYEGAAVYLWHCNREGEYSLYSQGIENENYLRGVQEVAADGSVQFTSVFPACYSGRWPHIHFEVYGSLDDATNATGKLRTTQIALPEDACNQVYGSAEGYEQSVTNLAQTSLDSDNVFSDGYALQLGTVTGSLDDGYTVTLNVPV